MAHIGSVMGRSRMDTEPSPGRTSRSMFAMLAEIQRNIASGVWGPGARLPTERELEQRFGVARNTLRKALKRLEAEGAIIRHVGRGTFVAPVATAADPAPLMQRLRGASPAEVMELRLLLEPQAAELAAGRASAAELQRIADCVDACESASSVAAFEHWDGRLHLAIIAAARNELLLALYEAINEVRNQPEWMRLKQRSVTPERRAIYQDQHRRILAALADRNAPEAARELSRHLLTVQANLLGG